MWKRAFWAALPMGLLLLIPLCLRPASGGGGGSDAVEQLVIITPHNETVRYEFALAFEEYYHRKTGRTIRVDYRNVGGTSDIVRLIADRYEAEFRREWEKNHPDQPWNAELAAAFSNQRFTPAAADQSAAAQARREFLKSEVGIGIDLFWGGGTYDHGKQARRGFGVHGGVSKRHPEILQESVIPQHWGGDDFYDREERYYGTCLSSFGICYNPDRLQELSDPSIPDSWHSLGEGRFFNLLVVADPTKSGSANKCFEAILQQCIGEAVAQHGAEKGIGIGWANGFNLIKRIVANSRMLTDSASKVPREISAGNAAAGMAIDTYGLTEQDWSETLFYGKPSIRYVPPRGGTAVSADPIQLLRGAPHREAAEMFIDYLLSVEGQKLWDFRAGTPGGPKHTALRRPPIRKDLYTPEHLQYSADPDYNPYVAGANFVYHPEWTGRYFDLIRVLIRCIALDVQTELRTAWKAILDAGGPEKVPEAMAAFNELPFPYENAPEASEKLRKTASNTVLDIVAAQREWSMRAMESCRRATALAKAGR